MVAVLASTNDHALDASEGVVAMETDSAFEQFVEDTYA